jgi:LuxR family transcriptional regulator
MAPKFVFQTYPKSRLDYYSSNGLIIVDPMVAWGFEHTGTQRWSGLDDSSGVMKMAADHGMKYGVVIATVSSDSCSLGGFSHTDREFTDAEIEELQSGVVEVHNHTAATAHLDASTIEHLKKMSIMVIHPGS